MSDDLPSLAVRLQRALGTDAVPVAMTFGEDAEPFGAPSVEPAPDGRTGAVPASCVFWGHGTERTFRTVPADHANCSVGAYVHGLIDLESAASAPDTAALVASDWVTPADLMAAERVDRGVVPIVYGPLAVSGVLPDAVVIRLRPAEAMVLSDAVPDLVVSGKPQCQIVPHAVDRGRVTASLGCAVSRARTGMAPGEMTCAIPGGRLAEVVEALECAAAADDRVATFARADAERFR